MNILVLMNSVVLMLPTGTAGYLILILVLSLLVVLLAIKNRKLVCEKKQYKDLLDDMQENNKEKEALFSLDILENLPFPLFVKNIDDDYKYIFWNKEAELHVLKSLWHITSEYPLCKSLYNRSLTYTRLTDKHRIVLCLP